MHSYISLLQSVQIISEKSKKKKTNNKQTTELMTEEFYAST